MTYNLMYNGGLTVFFGFVFCFLFCLFFFLCLFFSNEHREGLGLGKNKRLGKEKNKNLLKNTFMIVPKGDV